MFCVTKLLVFHSLICDENEQMRQLYYKTWLVRPDLTKLILRQIWNHDLNCYKNQWSKHECSAENFQWRADEKLIVTEDTLGHFAVRVDHDPFAIPSRVFVFLNANQSKVTLFKINYSIKIMQTSFFNVLMFLCLIVTSFVHRAVIPSKISLAVSKWTIGEVTYMRHMVAVH